MLKNIQKILNNSYPQFSKASYVLNDFSKYLDFTSNMGNNILGYNHSYINKNVLRSLSNLEKINIKEKSNQLTKKILNTLPDKQFNSIIYTNYSKDSILNTFNIAKSFTNKENILCINSRYCHNKTSKINPIVEQSMILLHTDNKLYFAKENCIECFDNTLEYVTNSKNTAAVIYEGSLGKDITSLERDYLYHVFEYCKKNNILIISDETESGFGRSGNFWNFNNKTSIDPDILLFGSSISNGYALSGTILNRSILNNINSDTFNNLSNNNSNIGILAANSTIDSFYRENILYNVKTKGLYLKNNLNRIPGIKGVYQEGLTICLDLFSFKEEHKSEIILQKLLENNILVTLCGENNEYIKILPPLNVNYKECDYFLETLGKILNQK